MLTGFGAIAAAIIMGMAFGINSYFTGLRLVFFLISYYYLLIINNDMR